SIIEKLQKKSIQILFIGMKLPTNTDKHYRDSFENVYASLAKKYKLNFIPFLLEGVASKREYNLSDGIHPNALGHRQIAKNLGPSLETMVKKILTQKSKGN